MRLLTFLALSLAAWAGPTVSILTTDGRTLEGTPSASKISVKVGSQNRDLSLDKILTIHNAIPATAAELDQINKSIQTIQGTDRKQCDQAVEVLSNLGIVAMTPLLKTYKDTDQHEPKPLYRLFDRLVPAGADNMDRSLAVIRLVGGEILRGTINDAKWQISGAALETAEIRRLAVRQKIVTKKYEVHSLRHSTQIEYLDSGVMLSSASVVESKSKGLVRLSWETDGWVSDADGLKVPGPNYKTTLVDGFPFGALVGRVGASGEIWQSGVNLNKKGLPAGRLYFAVNDNKHWQNNLGAFRVELRVTDAYDLGEPQ